jgi:hypothetical protein
MATYSAALSLAIANGNVLINSGGGVVPANQTIYTAPAGRKTIIELKGAVAITIGAGGSFPLKIEKQSSFNSTWVEAVAFTVSMSGGGLNSMSAFTMDAASRKALIDAGRVEGATVGDATASGNVRIVLYPGDRIRTAGGAVPEGSNYRFEYVTEQYFAA